MTEYKCGSAKSCKYGDMCKPNYDISACSHYKAEEPQTNEEWFVSLPTEEKAKFLREMVYYGCLYDEWEQQSITENVPTEVIIVEWLKQQHSPK